ncbi:hypothetical protein AB833_21280 [Chromatiales bacterium (ex Bugula neritina AB1)]|nr:hypothetical protein AB833_21280 [Chromatiales bacterium (ex Bugula neritina AB1)]
MEPSIFKYILRHSRKEQLLILLVTVLSMPLIYYSLEIPKLIINQAIGGDGIPASILGFSVNQISYLTVLCCAFLALTMINGGIKYHLNVYRGVLSERMLRRLRYELYSRVLRFPIPYFKRISQNEVVPIITAETEPLGGFISDAFALPAFQGGLLITYLAFIFNQDIYLGFAATAMYPLQMVVIPKLQKKVNQLSRKRVLTVRSLAARIGEAFAGITEIRSLDTAQFERADISDRLGSLFEIRKEIYKRKFFIKFLNNFLNQITPFFFYLVGGIFVINGKLSLGALIAVLAAYKDLAGPWKELLKYYQIKEDIRVKYAQIISQFQPSQLLDENLFEPSTARPEPLEGSLVSSGLTYAEEGGVRQLDGISFEIPVNQRVAIVGPSGGGKEALGRLIGGLINPSRGQLKVNGSNLAGFPVAATGQWIGYAGQNAYLFNGSVLDNLYYGLKNKPLSSELAVVGDEASDHRKSEALRTGNSVFDVRSSWINPIAAGVGNETELERKVVELLPVVELEQDIYELGLRSNLADGANSGLVEKLLRARRDLSVEIQQGDLADLVELFDYNQYNTNASVAENLLFGVPRDSSSALPDLINNPTVLQLLSRDGLLDELIEAGRKAAETMVDIFSDLPPGHEFFNRFSFISSDDLPLFKRMLGRIDVDGTESITEEEREQLLSVAFMLIPAQHRLGIIDDALQVRLVEARHRLADTMPEELSALVTLFSADQYSHGASVQDNILFGKLAYGQAKAEARVGELIRTVIEKAGIYPDVMRLGLSYDVGIGGANISIDQRQKIALVRILLKETDMLVINDAISVLDGDTSKRIIDNVQRLRGDRGLIWVLGDADLAQSFEQVLVLEKGRFITRG